MPGSTFVAITEATGAAINQRLGAHAVDIGGTTVLREEVVWAGTSSGQVAQFASGVPATNIIAPVVRIAPSTGELGQVSPVSGSVWTIAGNATISPAAGTTFNIGGNATAILANSSGAIATGNPLPVYLQGSTATVSVQGNTTALLANSSGAIATGNPLAVFLQGSTATVTIQGNTTAILTTGSKLQVEPVAGAVFGISGNATVAFTTGTTGRVELASGGVGGTSGNPLHITPTTTVPIAGNTTAVVANSSGGITTGNPLAVFLQGSTATVTIQGNASVAISGNSTAVLSNTSGNITTGNPLAVFLQGSTATVTVQGNTTAILTTASIVRADLSTGSPVYAAFGAASSSGGLVILGADGTATNSTVRPFRVNASQELLITGAVSVAGNASVVGNVTALITTGSIIRIDSPAFRGLGTTAGTGGLLVYGADGNTSNSTVRPLRVDSSGKLLVDAAVTIGGQAQILTTGGSTVLLVGGLDSQSSNATARALTVNSSGELLTVGGTVTVGGLVTLGASAGTTAMLVAGADGNTTNSTVRTFKINSSQELVITGAVTVAGNASVQGNVSAVISGNSTAVLSNTSGNITTANPLAVFLQGSTATVTIQGNTTAILSTASIVRVDLSTGSPVYAAFGAASSSGGLVVMGLDGTATNSTARPLQVDSSGKLKVDAGSISVGGLVQLGATGGSTAMLVAGMDGNTTNSTVRTFKVNASQELVVTGSVTIAGNASVQGNVSAVISGNATAVLSNTSGNITTANPLAVFLQGSTATVTIQGNSTAVLTTASLTRVDFLAAPVYAAFGANTASGGFVMMGLDGTATNSTARPLQVDSSGKLKVDAGAITMGGLVQLAATGGSTAMLVAGMDGNTTNSTVRALKVNASQELVITGVVSVAGNASVQGNVSAVISGNATAIISNTSGNITTANPLAIFLQGSTATVTIAGNSTAVITTGSKILVEGDIAHDATDTGNPIKLGGRAIAHGTNPTAVAAADRTNWNFNVAGVPWVIGGHPNIQNFRANTSANSTGVALVTVDNTLRVVVTWLAITVDEEVTNGIDAIIFFSSASGTPATTVATGILLDHPGLVPGGGMTLGNGAGILGMGASDQDLRYSVNAASGGRGVAITGGYYTIEA